MRASLRVWLAVSASVLVSVVVYARPAAPFGQAAGSAQASQKPAQPGQSGQASATPGPSAAEKQAYSDLVSEATAGLDPDRVVALAQEYEKKFPDSVMLTYVYAFEAGGDMAKGDYPKAVDASQKSLKLNGDNLNSLLLLARMLPQPQLMQGSDIDKQKRLDETETDAKHALDLINQNVIPKQPNETDDAYTKRKNAIASEPHGSLGMVHLQRATMGLTGLDQDELTKAAQEFKQSVEMTDRPQPEYYYRLGEAYKHQKKIDDAIAAFSKASELSQGTGLQQYADKQVEELKKMQTPAKPADTH